MARHRQSAMRALRRPAAIFLGIFAMCLLLFASQLLAPHRRPRQDDGPPATTGPVAPANFDDLLAAAKNQATRQPDDTAPEIPVGTRNPELDPGTDAAAEATPTPKPSEHDKALRSDGPPPHGTRYFYEQRPWLMVGIPSLPRPGRAAAELLHSTLSSWRDEIMARRHFCTAAGPGPHGTVVYCRRVVVVVMNMRPQSPHPALDVAKAALANETLFRTPPELPPRKAEVLSNGADAFADLEPTVDHTSHHVEGHVAGEEGARRRSVRDRAVEEGTTGFDGGERTPHHAVPPMPHGRDRAAAGNGKDFAADDVYPVHLRGAASGEVREHLLRREWNATRPGRVRPVPQSIRRGAADRTAYVPSFDLLEGLLLRAAPTETEVAGFVEGAEGEAAWGHWVHFTDNELWATDRSRVAQPDAAEFVGRGHERPTESVLQQSKDVARLLRFAAGRSDLFLFSEDDFHACRLSGRALTYIARRAEQEYGAGGWAAARCGFGLNGILMHNRRFSNAASVPRDPLPASSLGAAAAAGATAGHGPLSDLEAFGFYLTRHEQRRPPDHLVVEFYAREGRDGLARFTGRPVLAFRHNLFRHDGQQASTLRRGAMWATPRCFEDLVEPQLFAVEAWAREECAPEDVKPLPPAVEHDADPEGHPFGCASATTAGCLAEDWVKRTLFGPSGGVALGAAPPTAAVPKASTVFDDMWPSCRRSVRFTREELRLVSRHNLDPAAVRSLWYPLWSAATRPAE